ncbi:MAG: TetR/AcrR family transcriptional regulator, partial [Bdellovibrionales bacterium]|nr:TetR/AcrR family transcriptional regulator [Bdellovibrionales bacterium]
MAEKRFKTDGYHHGNLRTVLLRTSIRMLKTQPATELSLRKLAREAGVSQAAPYRHFKKKEDLIAALMTEGFEIKARYMKEAVEASNGDLENQLFACALSYFKMGKNHPQHFKLM